MTVGPNGAVGSNGAIAFRCLDWRIAYNFRSMPRRGSDPSPDASPKARVTRETLAQVFGLYAYMRPYRGRLSIGLVMLIGSSALGILFPLLSGLMIHSKSHEVAFHIGLLTICILFVQAVMSYFQSLLFNTVGEYGALRPAQGALRAPDRNADELFRPAAGGRADQPDVGRPDAIAGRLHHGHPAVPAPEHHHDRQHRHDDLYLAAADGCNARLLSAHHHRRDPDRPHGRQPSRTRRRNSRRPANVIDGSVSGHRQREGLLQRALRAKRYESKLAVFLSSVLRGASARASLVAFIIFAIFTAITIVLWYGTSLLIDGRLNSGELLSFTFYTIFVGGSIGSFADLYANLQRSIGATQHVRELLGDSRRAAECAGHRPNGGRPVSRRCSFDHVNFAYPSRPEVRC